MKKRYICPRLNAFDIKVSTCILNGSPVNPTTVPVADEDAEPNAEGMARRRKSVWGEEEEDEEAF